MCDVFSPLKLHSQNGALASCLWGCQSDTALFDIFQSGEICFHVLDFNVCSGSVFRFGRFGNSV